MFIHSNFPLYNVQENSQSSTQIGKVASYSPSASILVSLRQSSLNQSDWSNQFLWYCSDDASVASQILGEGRVLYPWDGVCYPGFSRYWTVGYSCLLYTIPGCTWDGVCYPWFSLLGEGDIAAYCIPSWDVFGMACVTRESWYSCILYTIPGCTWDGVCYPGFLRYSDKGV